MANGRSWSKEELEFLKKNYKRWGIAYCARKLKRTEGTTRWRANQLGLHVRTPQWSEQEVEILKAVWQHASYREMLHALKGRSYIALRKKATELKLGPRLQTMLSVREAADKVGVCRRQVLTILEFEGVKPVALNWGTTTVLPNDSAVGQFRLQSAVTKGRVLKFYEHQVLAAAKSYYSRETVEDAAARFGVYPDTLNRAARHFNIPKVSRKYRLKAKEWDDVFAQWKEYTRQRHALAAAKNGRKYKKRPEYLSALAATSTVPNSTTPDTGNALSINSLCPATTHTASISGS